VNVRPVSCVAETNDMPAGIGSDSETNADSSGPTFVTVNVYETSLPTDAAGGPSFSTARSAS
jgi:hypothetical protein